VRVAFYAPLKVPSHGTPSGDRRVAALYVEALQHAGHRVELASSLSSYDGEGSPERQAALRAQGLATAEQLVTQLQSGAQGSRPDLWFTYHVYYKAPDWLGPHVSKALGIPYVIAEASYAPKRAGGPWALGHDASGEAIRLADLLVCPTRFDLGCLEPIVADGSQILLLPPFLDMQPFDDALQARHAQRARLAAAHRLDASIPWIVIAAMMRAGDKAASYRQLADALARISDLPWQLLVAGDGRARPEVARALETAAPGRARLLGTLAEKEVAALYAAGDLCIWPACNEAYGMAMLEAQAAAVPVISCAHRGVPDVVLDGRTGLLAPAGDSAELARLARELLLDPGRRTEMGRAARQFVAGERSLERAAQRLGQALGRLGARGAADPATRAN
jgi:glycosyltransferase involved in cell wall biosynthesis